MPVHIVPVHTPVVAVAELALHVSCVVRPNLVYPTVHVTIAVSRYSVPETNPNAPLMDGGDPQSTAERNIIQSKHVYIQELKCNMNWCYTLYPFPPLFLFNPRQRNWTLCTVFVFVHETCPKACEVK